MWESKYLSLIRLSHTTIWETAKNIAQSPEPEQRKFLFINSVFLLIDHLTVSVEYLC